MIGVSPDGPESHREFIDKFNLPSPLLCDPDKKVMETYGAWGEKMMYGVKKIGVIRSTIWIDPEGVVKKHLRKVPDAGKHPEKVTELEAKWEKWAVRAKVKPWPWKVK